MAEAQSGAALLRRIKPQLREMATNLCLRPDLLDEWEELQEKLGESRVKDATAGRLAEGTSKKTRELATRVQEIEAEIEAVQFRVLFRAMAKDDWQALCERHPPRKGNDIDMFAGYNRDAVYDAAVRACMVDPVFEDCPVRGCPHEDCGSWQQFVKVLNPSEWAELRDTVTEVNKGVTEAPKSQLAATVLSRPGAASRQRKRGE